MPPVLYHYCSVQTFVSIIENTNIWLSDANKTNDSTETKWMFSKMQEVINQAIEKYKNKYDEDVLELAKNITHQLIENIVTKKAPIDNNAKNFLICFSEAKDLLSQWRAYGNDGKGIAIGFNSSILASLENSSGFSFTKVIYDSKKIMHFLHKSYDKQLEWAIKSCIDKKTKNINIQELMLQISVIIISIWREGFVFKHSCFSEEQEWRIFRKF